MLLEASVLVELVVAGRHRAGADVLLDRYRADPGITFISAAHGLIEAIGALRGMTLRGDLSSDQARQALEWLLALDLGLDPTGPRGRRVWLWRDRMSAYDAAYAAAAEALDTPLLTVDARLLHACRQAGVPAAHLDELAARG